MKIIEYKISDLIPYDKNSKKHDKTQIENVAQSIKEYGFVQPIVIDKNNVVVIGHCRLLAAKKLKMSDVPCVCVEDLTEEQVRKLRIIDNKSNESDWDFDFLNEELLDLDFSDFNFDFGIDTDADEEVEIVEDEAPEVDEDAEPISKLGEIYQLGNHRLMCGDSTSVTDVEKLMSMEKADISFTSPPYNAGTTPTEVKMGKFAKYQNDDDNKSEKDYLQFLLDFTNNAIRFSKYTFVNIQSLSNNKNALIDYLYELKSVYADTMIWDKMLSQPAMAENVLNSEFEYIHIFSEKANRAIGSKKFRGTISNILHLQKQNRNEYSKIHNATFPIELASFFVGNFAENSVLDLFGGTGTTLLASEQLNKNCYMMEFDPKYIDVIIKRWETFTGKKAILLNKGEIK